MDQPVNFDNLRVITGGDAALEAVLFESFLHSAADCLAGLRAAYAADDESAWKSQAHALKGVSLNLGAEPLGELCKTAQNDCRATRGEKQKMLEDIEKEWLRVEAAVKNFV